MRVLVTFAVDAEFAPWRKLRSFKKSIFGQSATARGAEGFSATVDEHPIEVLLTGMGREICEQTLGRLDFSGDKKPDVVISSGLAGALREELRPGDIFVPRRVRTLDNDSDATSDAAFVERAAQSGAKCIETLITAKQLVKTAEEKKRLGFFGEAVDMESAFVMRRYCAMRIPCLTIRAISDSVEEDLPIDFDRCLTPRGSVRPLSLVNTIVERPSRLAKLVRFGKQSNEAANEMIRFLDGFIGTLRSITAEAT